MIPRLLILIFVLGLYPTFASAQELSVSGLWMTEDKGGVVEVYPCGVNNYCGRFYWLKNDSADKPSLDDRNPDVEKKKTPLCGMTFMGGFSDSGTGRYVGGWIYSIRHGATFSASLNLVDADTLELRGYVFIPLLGGSQRWTRVATTEPCSRLH